MYKLAYQNKNRILFSPASATDTPNQFVSSLCIRSAISAGIPFLYSSLRLEILHCPSYHRFHVNPFQNTMPSKLSQLRPPGLSPQSNTGNPVKKASFCIPPGIGLDQYENFSSVILCGYPTVSVSPGFNRSNEIPGPENTSLCPEVPGNDSKLSSRIGKSLKDCPEPKFIIDVFRSMYRNKDIFSGSFHSFSITSLSF